MSMYSQSCLSLNEWGSSVPIAVSLFLVALYSKAKRREIEEEYNGQNEVAPGEFSTFFTSERLNNIRHTITMTIPLVLVCIALFMGSNESFLSFFLPGDEISVLYVSPKLQWLLTFSLILWQAKCAESALLRIRRLLISTNEYGENVISLGNLVNLKDLSVSWGVMRRVGLCWLACSSSACPLVLWILPSVLLDQFVGSHLTYFVEWIVGPSLADNEILFGILIPFVDRCLALPVLVKWLQITFALTTNSLGSFSFLTCLCAAANLVHNAHIMWVDVDDIFVTIARIKNGDVYIDDDENSSKSDDHESYNDNEFYEETYTNNDRNESNIYDTNESYIHSEMNEMQNGLHQRSTRYNTRSQSAKKQQQQYQEEDSFHQSRFARDRMYSRNDIHSGYY